MAKKKVQGRPKGKAKEAVNIYMEKERAGRLRKLAVDQQRNISTIVENALIEAYKI